MDFGDYEHLNLVIAGIIGFFILRVGIGFWVSRRVSDAADYIVAGRGLPIYMAAASIMATWFAGETLTGASAHAYQYGFQGVVFDPFGAVVCLLISGLFFSRLMRRARYLTVVDFFQKRFGPGMGLLGSVVQLLAYFAWTAAQIVAGGHIIHTLLGWPAWVGMIVIGTTVTLYTTLGGMLADTLLDFIQMFLTAGGITAVFLYVLNAVGGWEAMVTNPTSQAGPNAFALLPLSDEQGGFLGYKGVLGWLYCIAAWITIGFGSVATQDLMQRSMSARNEATSVWGSYLAGLLYFTFGVMSPLIGIMVFKLHPDLNESQVEGLLVLAAKEYLPTAMTVLFIAALTSALMSTADSSILAGASVVTENVFPLFGFKLDDQRQLVWTRIMVLVNGAISIGVAILISAMYQLAMVSWAVLLVGMFAPFAFGMYWSKANRFGAFASAIGGFGVWIAGMFYVFPETKLVNTTGGELSLDDAIWDAMYIASAPAFVVSVMLMFVVSLLTQKIDPPLPLTDVDGNPLALERRLGLVSPAHIFKDSGDPNPFTKDIHDSN